MLTYFALISIAALKEKKYFSPWLQLQPTQIYRAETLFVNDIDLFIASKCCSFSAEYYRYAVTRGRI